MVLRRNALRVTLYCLAGGFVLYLVWPLLHGQASSRSPERTSPSPWPLVTERKQETWRKYRTVRTTRSLPTPLDGPVQEVVVLGAWKQTNCGSTHDPLRISIKHVEIQAGEHLMIDFNFELDIQLSAPLQVNITQWTMVSEDVWRLEPCSEIRGSCYIADLCTDFKNSKCPSLRGWMEPSLQCPIQPGKYSVPTHYYPTMVQFYLQPVATRYHFKHHGQHIACYDMLLIGDKL